MDGLEALIVADNEGSQYYLKLKDSLASEGYKRESFKCTKKCFTALRANTMQCLEKKEMDHFQTMLEVFHVFCSNSVTHFKKFIQFGLPKMDMLSCLKGLVSFSIDWANPMEDTLLMIEDVSLYSKVGSDEMCSMIPLLISYLAFFTNNRDTIKLRIQLCRVLNVLLEQYPSVKRSTLIKYETIRNNVITIGYSLPIAGDFDYQQNLLEFIFRLTDRTSRDKLGHLWFDKFHLTQDFLDMREQEFDVDSRSFLNKLNESCGPNRSVYTFACHEIKSGKKNLFAPPELAESWVDFNTISKCLCFCVEEGGGAAENGNEPGNALWEFVFVKSEDVRTWAVTDGGDGGVVIKMELHRCLSDVMDSMEFTIVLKDKSDMVIDALQKTFENKCLKRSGMKQSVVVEPIRITRINQDDQSLESDEISPIFYDKTTPITHNPQINSQDTSSTPQDQPIPHPKTPHTSTPMISNPTSSKIPAQELPSSTVKYPTPDPVRKVPPPREPVPDPVRKVPPPREPVPDPVRKVPPPREPVPDPVRKVPPPREPVPDPVRKVPPPREPVPDPVRKVPPPREPVPNPVRKVPPPREPVPDPVPARKSRTPVKPSPYKQTPQVKKKRNELSFVKTTPVPSNLSIVNERGKDRSCDNDEERERKRALMDETFDFPESPRGKKRGRKKIVNTLKANKKKENNVKAKEDKIERSLSLIEESEAYENVIRDDGVGDEHHDDGDEGCYGDDGLRDSSYHGDDAPPRVGSSENDESYHDDNDCYQSNHNDLETVSDKSDQTWQPNSERSANEGQELPKGQQRLPLVRFSKNQLLQKSTTQLRKSPTQLRKSPQKSNPVRGRVHFKQSYPADSVCRSPSSNSCVSSTTSAFHSSDVGPDPSIMSQFKESCSVLFQCDDGRNDGEKEKNQKKRKTPPTNPINKVAKRSKKNEASPLIIKSASILHDGADDLWDEYDELMEDYHDKLEMFEKILCHLNGRRKKQEEIYHKISNHLKKRFESEMKLHTKDKTIKKRKDSLNVLGMTIRDNILKEVRRQEMAEMKKTFSSMLLYYNML